MSRDDCELQQLLPTSGYITVATGHADTLEQQVKTLQGKGKTYRIINYYSFVLGTYK